MGDQANNTSANEASNGARQEWPQRFGTMTKLQVKQGRKGEYGIITIDCVKFTQTAMVFNKMALDKLKAAGEGAKIWVKGPIESVERKNAQGGTYSEDMFKVVYAKDITPEPEAEDGEGEAEAEAPAGETGEADVDASTASDAASKDVDDEIPF